MEPTRKPDLGEERRSREGEQGLGEAGRWALLVSGGVLLAGGIGSILKGRPLRALAAVIGGGVLLKNGMTPELAERWEKAFGAARERLGLPPLKAESSTLKEREEQAEAELGVSERKAAVQSSLDVVSEASEESFPASDPPGWM